jgi:hypothetical protein
MTVKKKAEQLGITIFTYLNNIFYKQGLAYDKKVAPAYLLSLWLSHDPSLIHIVNKINELHFNISDELIYTYYYEKIPKGKRFIQWVKKDEKDKKIKEKVTAFQDVTGLSKKEASNYLWYINNTEFTKDKKDDKVSTKTFFKE